MSYEFPSDVRKLISEQMSAGGYPSEDDLLRDALRALDAERQLPLEEDPNVVEGIRRGLIDMEAGRCQSLTEFDAQFKTRNNIR